MNAQLHFLFDGSGNWSRFTMRSSRAEGRYSVTDRVSPEAIMESGHAEALASVTAAIVSLGEPWAATQAWVHLRRGYAEPDPSSTTQFEPLWVEWVELDVEARGDGHGGLAHFTSRDYPCLRISAPSVVAAFKHFTHQS